MVFVVYLLVVHPVNCHSSVTLKRAALLVCIMHQKLMQEINRCAGAKQKSEGRSPACVPTHPLAIHACMLHYDFSRVAENGLTSTVSTVSVCRKRWKQSVGSYRLVI